jgi:hypothetical protein
MKISFCVGIVLCICTSGTLAQQVATTSETARAPLSKSARDDHRQIGTATMLRDRTIILDLRAETGKAVGEARFSYKPGDPKYLTILRHLGGIKPGESKAVLPFDSPKAVASTTAK